MAGFISGDMQWVRANADDTVYNICYYFHPMCMQNQGNIVDFMFMYVFPQYVSSYICISEHKTNTQT